MWEHGHLIIWDKVCGANTHNTAYPSLYIHPVLGLHHCLFGSRKKCPVSNSSNLSNGCFKGEYVHSHSSQLQVSDGKKGSRLGQFGGDVCDFYHDWMIYTSPRFQHNGSNWVLPSQHALRGGWVSCRTWCVQQMTAFHFQISCGCQFLFLYLLIGGHKPVAALIQWSDVLFWW